MADQIIKFLSLDGLINYDEKIKAFIEAKISEGDLHSFKWVDLADGVLKFYTINPLTEGAVPAFELELPEQDLSNLMELVSGATEGNIAMLDSSGQAIDGNLAVSDIATKEEIHAVEEFMGELPEGASSTTLADFVMERTSGIASDENLTALTDRVTAAESELDAIQADYLTSESEIFETDLLTINALGGIAANTDLNGMTTHAILNKLLFPYVAQVVDTPSRTPNSTVLEKGNNQTITAVSVKVTKKSEPITSVALYNGSVLLAEKTGDEVAKGGTFTFSGLSVSVPSTSVVLTVKVTDASGNVVSKNTAGWTFVYPYYTGVCDVDAEINEDLVEGLTKKVEAKGNKTWSFTTDNQRCVIAYPKAHGVLKNAIDPNGFENISSFTQYEVSVTGLDGTPQAYYVYANGASTVTNFAFTFKH